MSSWTPAARLIAFVLAIAAALQPAQAQTFPERPVHVIVPFPAGGPVDVLARALGEGFRERTGQGFVIENKPGANTAIGAAACKNAEPNGYTVCLLTSSTISINPFLYANLSYDPQKDLAPVTNVVIAQQLFMVHSSVPATTFKDLVTYSQANPEKLNYGTFGVGGEGHLVTEWLKAKTGARLTHLPFTGAAPALVAFERGDVHVMYLVASPVVTEKVRSGQAKGLFVTGSRRSPNLPGVPMMKEAGLPQIEFDSWFGMLAPVRTPRERIERIQSVVGAVIRSEPFQQKYVGPNGYTGVGEPPEAFARFLAEDRKKAEDLVKVSGVKIAP